MMKSGLRGEKLTWIFLLSSIVISYPILTIFNVNVLVWNIPLLYLYIFLVWIAIILAVYLVIGRKQPAAPTEDSEIFPPLGGR
jgi:hypothetical protein